VRFGINLASITSRILGSGAQRLTLKKVTDGAWQPGYDQGKERTTTDHLCRGYRVEFDSSLVDGTTVRKEDCIIRVYAKSLPASVQPTANDRIVLAGTEYEIVHVGGDPAQAVHVLHARGPGL
jgi:hypothetical protein